VTQPQDANDLLMSGGVKAAKFDTLGETVLGTITDQPRASQMTKYQSDELDYWPSGDPKMQIVVTLQTDQRDPANAQDDGRRRLFIVPRMMQPVREAVLRSGAKGLAIGGRLAVRWVSGTGQGEGNAKQYAAEYAPPAVDPGGLLGGQANATPAAPAPAPAAAPAPQASLLASVTPAAAAAPPPPGVDPVVWANLPDGQRQAVLAAMTAPGAAPGF
jgi:hypothetical protein